MKHLLLPVLLLAILGTACAGDPLKAPSVTDAGRIQDDARHAQEVLDTYQETSTTTTTAVATPPAGCQRMDSRGHCWDAPNWDRDIGNGKTLGQFADEYQRPAERDYAAEDRERRLDRLEEQQRHNEMRETMCRIGSDRDREIWAC